MNQITIGVNNNLLQKDTNFILTQATCQITMLFELSVIVDEEGSQN